MTKGKKNLNNKMFEFCTTHTYKFISEKIMTDFSKIQFFDLEKKPNKNWANNCDHEGCNDISNFRLHVDFIP